MKDLTNMQELYSTYFRQQAILEGLQEKIEELCLRINTLNSQIFNLEDTIFNGRKENTYLRNHISQLQAENKKLQNSLNKIRDNNFKKGNNFKISDISKVLGMSGKELVQLLKENNIIETYQNSTNQLIHQYRNLGYDIQKDKKGKKSEINYNSSVQKHFTMKGAKWLFDRVLEIWGEEDEEN